MPDRLFNKYRAAIEVLQSGRDVLVEGLANEILEQGEDLIEGGFLFNEFLETQGTRLHFLGLLVSQLEQSAEALEGVHVPPPPSAQGSDQAANRERSRRSSSNRPPRRNRRTSIKHEAWAWTWVGFVGGARVLRVGFVGVFRHAGGGRGEDLAAHERRELVGTAEVELARDPGAGGLIEECGVDIALRVG